MCDKEAKGFIFWAPGLVSGKLIATDRVEKENIYDALGQVLARNVEIPTNPYLVSNVD